MEIRFENDNGCARFFGGGSKGSWHILDVSGLALPPINESSVTYYGEDGRETVNRNFSERTITLSAEVKGQNRTDRAKIVSDTLKILAKEGILSVRTHCEKVIPCFLKTMTEGARDGNFRRYVFQFVCDKPFFRDKKATNISLCGRDDLLKDTFTIGDGIVFTKRFSGGVIRNDSDVKIEPVLTLSSNGSSEAVKIVNKTTGASLVLEVEENKIYTVDLYNRTITDENGENCLYILGDGCYMSEFYLKEGINEIETNGESSRLVSLYCSFYKQYVEATD